jgi:hypothetical protein
MITRYGFGRIHRQVIGETRDLRAGLLHPTGELSFGDFVAVPRVEGALGLGCKGSEERGVSESPSRNGRSNLCQVTTRWSARVGDKVPSPDRRSRGAQLNR